MDCIINALIVFRGKKNFERNMKRYSHQMSRGLESPLVNNSTDRPLTLIIPCVCILRKKTKRPRNYETYNVNLNFSLL